MSNFHKVRPPSSMDEAIEQKKELRDKINKDVEDFLKRGGEVQQVPIGETRDKRKTIAKNFFIKNQREDS